MKKLLFTMALAAASLCAYAQSDATNIGINQLSEISPAPGKFSLESHEMGFASIIINFASDLDGIKGKAAEVNRDADLCVTLKRNGEVIANVPASNTVQIKYDSYMYNNWCISFFATPGYENFAGGHYQVIIPAGLFLIGSSATPNTEIVLNYYMELPNYSIYPAEAGNHPELQDFVLTFGKAVTVEHNPEVTTVFNMFDLFAGDVEVGEGEEAPIDPETIPELSYDGNNVYLHLIKPITSPGLWMFNIPDKYFILTDSEGTRTYSSELSFQYRIPSVTVENQPVANPPSGDVIYFPGYIELTLKEGQTLKLPNNMGQNSLYQVNEDGSLGDAIADYRAASKLSSFYYELDKDGKPDKSKPIADNANKIFLVNLQGEDVYIYPSPGKYRLVTTKALYTFNQNGKDYTSPAFTYDYTVVESDYFNMEFTPDKNLPVKELKEISVRFPDADEIVVHPNVAWFRSSTTNYQFYPRLSSEDPQTVIFSTPVAVTVPGVYRLTSDTKSIEIDGEYVGVVVEYTVSENSGIECIDSVKVLPAVFDIYNAQGMLISKNATVDVLNSLPAGIYIAGGQKIINR
ncbi:MAG: hypothetical protein K2J15_05655 [Muribaculaceae bacterium]|nr:hypothetical protein [Muribaculaceae bacterium]